MTARAAPGPGAARPIPEDPLEPVALAAGYRLVAELLLNPEQRDPGLLSAAGEVLSNLPDAARVPVETFLASPSAGDVEEYTAVLELTPPVPLYLGAHLFDEPNSCRGAGFSGRNGYMLEVAAVYRHYGLGLGSRELADYLPAMVEFLAISLDHPERDRIGIRRRFVEHYVLPGLPKVREALEKFGSVYKHLLAALEALVEEDVIAGFALPMWIPPVRTGNRLPSAPTEAGA